MSGKVEDEGPDPVDVHVGLAVKAYRLRAGMNQQSLGKAVKVTFQQIQKYEKGANRISASMLHRIGPTPTLNSFVRGTHGLVCRRRSLVLTADHQWVWLLGTH
jgi:transcriptional regulator with XRE-family HTH domain